MTQLADPPTLAPRSAGTPPVHGRFVDDDGLDWYRIDNYDSMDPFLVTVVTPDDQWIFVSTSGALTAGRQSATRALFPYETDDRLHRAGGSTGPVTVLRVSAGGADRWWQPFDTHATYGTVHRSVAKTEVGDRLRFSEHHPELGITFSYTWAAAGRFGLARLCRLTLDDDRAPLDVELLDGLVDVLPAGVELATQQSSSTLVDAYRRSQFDPDSGLAVFTLEALVADKADPAESLAANVVWSRGLPEPVVALSDSQIRRFRSGLGFDPEHLVTGRKGAFLQAANLHLEPGEPIQWLTVGDVAVDHRALAALGHRVVAPGFSAGATIEAEMESAHDAVVGIVAAADGLQVTADRRSTVHHFANTLFNVMRGGVFLDGHQVEVADVGRFIARRNVAAAERFTSVAASGDLDAVVDIDDLRSAVIGDTDLVRLVNEYLPLIFSRRHGDPSRPWNRFNIPARHPGGSLPIGYEGNWRDIFQNWEALVHSFPHYIESVIAKFLNASTMDGHNPYRLTDAGIDWEVPEDGDWGNFGYWGDHQIVYLHRLLVAAERFHPGLLESHLNLAAHSYADVPYRIRPYADLVADPKHTLDFDWDRHEAIEARCRRQGADARLVAGPDGAGVHHATLAEKLMVPALAKLSNLVAGAGIWMNTQRPEWNDANNALVGNGVSTVTMFHLRDYLRFVDGLLARASVGEVGVGERVAVWMHDLAVAFESAGDLLDPAMITPEGRRRLLDTLGEAYSRYRTAVYDHGPGRSSTIPIDELRRFLAVTAPHLDVAATMARREDGLVHTYWLVHLGDGTAEIEPLYEMLEGQAVALGSVDMDVDAVIRTVDTLYASELYRPDQHSFVLYPNRRPPAFSDKNRIPESAVGPGIAGLLEVDSRVVARDVDGVARFDAGMRSARHLEAALDELEADPRLASRVAAARPGLLAAYEEVFNHRAFTGRSQTMYRYEGLGSIYWHMVSKLLIALQDQILDRIGPAHGSATAGDGSLDELIDRYHRVRAGLGFMKEASVQGSFPTDPHSHTPAHTGAQQPGMTGQVKEGVLLRFGELGIRVEGGRLFFRPILLHGSEFLSESVSWSVLGPEGRLEAGSLGFTYCGVPVVYTLADKPSTVVHWRHGGESTFDSGLDAETSAAVFARTGLIARIEVGVRRSELA